MGKQSWQGPNSSPLVVGLLGWTPWLPELKNTWAGLHPFPVAFRRMYLTFPQGFHNFAFEILFKICDNVWQCCPWACLCFSLWCSYASFLYCINSLTVGPWMLKGICTSQLPPPQAKSWVWGEVLQKPPIKIMQKTAGILLSEVAASWLDEMQKMSTNCQRS